MKLTNLVTLSLLASVMAGCTVGGFKKEFGCSGLPDGVVCKTPAQIYDMTEGDQLGVYQHDLHQHAQPNEGMFKSDTPKTHSNNAGVMETQMVNLFTKPQFQANSNPMPVLEQPKVLRIWVAPWKDENETLNWSTYLFTEVTPRRWNFGDSVMRNTPITAPNKADYKSPSETMTPEQVGKDARNATDQEVENINEEINQANQPQETQQNIPAGVQRQNQLFDDGTAGM